MNLFESPDTIKLLRDLLKDPNLPSSESEDDDDVEPAGARKNRTFGPGNIGCKTSNRTKKSQTSSKDPETKPLLEKQESKDGPSKNSKIADIDQWLDQQQKEDDLILESRKRPEYTIAYKQAVGTEDLYLQMGNRTAATMSCEDMILDIKLPEETVTIEEMILSVTEDEIDLQTPTYRLKLPLMQKINPDKGKAKYDPDRKILTLTLRMIRDLDFVNF